MKPPGGAAWGASWLVGVDAEQIKATIELFHFGGALVLVLLHADVVDPSSPLQNVFPLSDTAVMKMRPIAVSADPLYDIGQLARADWNNVVLSYALEELERRRRDGTLRSNGPIGIIKNGA